MRQMRKGAVALATCLTLAACGAKDKKATETPVANESAAPAPAPKETTAVAQGEMRDILLSLHRVHFPFDSTLLTPDSRNALADAGLKLANHPDVRLIVEGHADERGTEEYNLALGDLRANVVANYLSAIGVDRDRLQTISYGEERPLALGSDPRAMAENRRVDFKLLRGDVRLVLEEGVLLDDAGTPVAGQRQAVPAALRGSAEVRRARDELRSARRAASEATQEKR